MFKTLAVGMSSLAMLSAIALASPAAADPVDAAEPRSVPAASTAVPAASNAVPATAVTPEMRREINRVVSAGQATRVAPSSGARALAAAGIRCATFEGERYCLGYGWTDRTAAELKRDLVKREQSARTVSGRNTGDLSVVDSLRQRARKGAGSRTTTERDELLEAARATGKVLMLRNQIEGQPYPAGFFARHPEVAQGLSMAAARAKYPSSKYVLNWRHTRPQWRYYWCGPATMQQIGWGWKGGDKPIRQRKWANRLGTTTSGTGIWQMVSVINKHTGFDSKKYAGQYVVLDISDYGYKQWYQLHKRHYSDYRAPVVMHPVLDGRYFDYLQGRTYSGHYQVGRGYNNRRNGPSTLGLFEPYNPRRFNPTAPRVRRLQYHTAYQSYLANKAHPQQNIGV